MINTMTIVLMGLSMGMLVPTDNLLTSNRSTSQEVTSIESIVAFTPPEEGVPGRREGGGTR